MIATILIMVVGIVLVGGAIVLVSTKRPNI
jgi:hypothetical protein